MTDAGAAVGMDRLPWLDDEPTPRAQPKLREPKPPRPRPTSRSLRELAGWAVAALLLVAGASYWLGMQSAEEPVSAPAPEATMRLPEVRTTPAEPETAIVETPEVRAAPAAPARRVESGRASPGRRRTLAPMDMKDSDLAKTVSEQEGAPAKPDAKVEPAKAAPAPAVRPLASRDELKLWPSRVSKGASGRLVQIGAFGSRHQAKLGWRRMKRAYPAVGRLPAVVVEARNSRGRRFYRFQIGTTSQAHSEVLCQRMERIRFSCAVVGLPWKAKVER